MAGLVGLESMFCHLWGGGCQVPHTQLPDQRLQPELSRSKYRHHEVWSQAVLFDWAAGIMQSIMLL